VKGVMLFSENVYGYQLEKFREVFGCPIVSHVRPLRARADGGTMPDDDRYFFWPQYGHFELLDAADRPVTQPGKLGFIVGTSFDNNGDAVHPLPHRRPGVL
jgi:phenylacetate-CoA ligase